MHVTLFSMVILFCFLYQAHRDMDYIVKDKLFFERVIGMEFIEPLDKSIFYNGKLYCIHITLCDTESICGCQVLFIFLQGALFIYKIIHLASYSLGINLNPTGGPKSIGIHTGLALLGHTVQYIYIRISVKLLCDNVQS